MAGWASYVPFGTLVTGMIAGTVKWGFRLEGKVKEQDTRHEALKELIVARLDDNNQRLERIEGNVDMLVSAAIRKG